MTSRTSHSSSSRRGAPPRSSDASRGCRPCRGRRCPPRGRRCPPTRGPSSRERSNGSSARQSARERSEIGSRSERHVLGYEPRDILGNPSVGGGSLFYESASALDRVQQCNTRINRECMVDGVCACVYSCDVCAPWIECASLTVRRLARCVGCVLCCSLFQYEQIQYEPRSPQLYRHH